MVKKRKNATDNILVERIEFSNIVRCCPSPKSQMLKIVNTVTTIVTVKTVLLVTSFLSVGFMSFCCCTVVF